MPTSRGTLKIYPVQVNLLFLPSLNPPPGVGVITPLGWPTSQPVSSIGCCPEPLRIHSMSVMRARAHDPVPVRTSNTENNSPPVKRRIRYSPKQSKSVRVRSLLRFQAVFFPRAVDRSKYVRLSASLYPTPHRNDESISNYTLSC